MRKDLIVIATLLCLTFLFHSELAFRSKVPLPGNYFSLINPTLSHESDSQQAPWNALQWDAVAQYWPWRHVAHNELQANRIPLWNSFTGLGMPLLANPQTAIFYLPNLLFWLGDVPRAFANSAILHTFLALIFTYLLCRSLCLPRGCSVVGATVYAFSSFMVTWQLLPTLTNTAVWLPLMILLVHKLSDANTITLRNRISLTLTLAGITALMLLAGHPQVALYILIAVGLYTLMRLIHLVRRRMLIRDHWSIVIALSFGILIASIQLMPSYELSLDSHRKSQPTWTAYQGFAMRGLQMEDTAMATLPYALGKPQDGSYHGKENFADYCPYVGVGTLLLSLVALTRRRNPSTSSESEVIVSFGLLGLFALLLAAGTPLNMPLYFLVPGGSQLGTPTRVAFVFQLCLGVLAAIGLHRLSATRQTKYFLKPLVILGALVFTAQITAGISLQVSPTQNLGVLLGWLMLGLLVAGAFSWIGTRMMILGTTILIAAELFWFGFDYNPTATKTQLAAVKEMRDELQSVLPGLTNQNLSLRPRILPLSESWNLYKLPPALLPPNTSSLLGLNDVQSYDSLMHRDYKQLMKEIEGGPPTPVENGNMILLRRPKLDKLANIGVRYLLTKRPLSNETLLMQRGKTKSGVYIYELLSASESRHVNYSLTPHSYKFGAFVSLVSLTTLFGLLAGSFVFFKIDFKSADNSSEHQSS